MENKELYADIILPLGIDSPTYTYAVPEALEGEVFTGGRVIVQVGSSKYYSGVVYRLHGDRPRVRTVKYIGSVVDDRPVVTDEQFKLWEWMAAYYMSSMGMVMRTALPARLKMDGMSHEEAVHGGYAVRRVAHIRLHPSIVDEESLGEACESLKRAKAQYAALMEYIERVGVEIDFENSVPVRRDRLSASAAVIKKLLDKNILQLVELELPPETAWDTIAPLPELTPAQSRAANEIRESLREKDAVLLHGVTGSGKTEIYIHFIAEELRKGKNVLYMLPEIALTSQLIERLQAYFGDRVIVYHSRVADNRRASIYLRLLNAGKSQEGVLIVGVRSSVLLPVPDLSLVVVDEEHDPSFKQTDTSPRYHARDTAIVLAGLHGAKTILGSATPSVESYFNAVSGKKYGYVTLCERYGDVQMPVVIISDTLRAARRGEKVSHFNRILVDKMDEALNSGEQVILFQNRRGFSPFVECGTCGWTAACPNCNVTLTYHKTDGELKCHYCGFHKKVPVQCPSCKAEDILPRGFGTEKIEEELFRIFPLARIERLDGDTARSMKNYQRIIRSFERGETDILVGTQMITKGFDFGNVSLAGILNADNLLNFPDFRAAERAFQLMVQVAGRAGRRQKQGTVIIQTAQPANPVLKYVAEYDYDSFVRGQLAERLSFNYPPYCRLISVSMYHRDHDRLHRGARLFENEARKVFGQRLLGPEPPPVDKIKNEYILRFLLKIERENSFARAKILLEKLLKNMTAQEEYKHIGIRIDVDPQ